MINKLWTFKVLAEARKGKKLSEKGNETKQYQLNIKICINNSASE